MRWKRELRRVRNIRVGIRERSEFKLVERKKIARGVSCGETARSTKPRHGAKDRAAAIFRPPTGLCGTRPIPMARAMGYFLSPCGLEKRPCVLATYGLPRIPSESAIRPGCSTLERFVVRLRSRVETRVWRLLVRGGATSQQRSRLEHLLTTPEGNRGSRLDKLRSGPTRVSGPSLRAAVNRLKSVRELGITVPSAQRIPEGRIASLARFANRAKVSLIARMPPARRLATLVAFIYSLEGTAQDDVLEVLESLLHGLFGNAEKSDQKARLRTLKDLDQATATLADACRLLLDPTLPDDEVRAKVFEKISKTTLESTLENVSALIRPPDDVFYKELNARYGAVRRWLPAVLKHLVFDASPAGRPVVEAYDWLRDNLHLTKSTKDAPRGVIGNAWQRYVLRKDGSVDLHAYTFCMLDRLATAIHRRDVFTKPSWRYADPRANLLNESEWEDMRPVVSRSLGWSAQPQPVLEALTNELDRTYREVAQRLSNNPAVRFETVNGKEELILTPLEKLEEPTSLIQLREAIEARLPRLDLPEIVMEIAARTGFAEVFTHLTERTARVADLSTSVCAVLAAEACNTGPEPFIRYDNPALRRDRLAWVKQHYVRDDTLTAANARLVSAQNKIALAHRWGGGEVASVGRPNIAVTGGNLKPEIGRAHV